MAKICSRKTAVYSCNRGDCGTGKITLLRKFKNELDSKYYKFLYVSDSKLTPRNFYRQVLEQLGFEANYHSGEAKRQLHREIEIMKGAYNIHPVCVCDECHLMKRNVRRNQIPFKCQT